MRHRLIFVSALVAVLCAVDATAASRTISGTLYRPNGTPWAGGVLTVQLTASFSNVGQTVVPQTWRVTANASGVVSVAILVPDTGSATYTFTLPDGTSADATLGAGAALALETIFTTALTDPTAETTLADLIAAMSFTASGAGAVARTVLSRLAETISVKDFGAVGNGSTDDTAAIQAAFTAAYTTGQRGRSVFIPDGDYKVTSTLTIHDVFGIRVFGAGNKSRLLWYGATGTGPLLKITSSNFGSFSHFTIQAAGASNILSIGVWMYTAVGSTYVSKQNRFEHVFLDGGNGNLTTGFRIGGSTSTEGVNNANNDFHQFDNVTVAQLTGDGFIAENSQVYNLLFVDCMVSGTAGATGSGVNTYLGGNFTWIGGEMSVRNGTAFKIGNLSGGTTIIGADVESTARILTTSGAASASYKSIIIDNMDFRSNSLHADGVAIQVEMPGSLVVRNSKLGNDATKAMKFSLGSGSFTNPRSWRFTGNDIKASDVTVAGLFPVDVPTILENNIGLDGSGLYTRIGGAPFATSGISLGAAGLTFSSAVPVYASGFGTGRTFTGTAAAFRINVGTGGTASSGVFTLPAASTGWNCAVQNITAYAANRPDQRTVQTADTTTTVTIQNQTISTGAALAWTASDIVKGQCAAY